MGRHHPPQTHLRRSHLAEIRLRLTHRGCGRTGGSTRDGRTVRTETSLKPAQRAPEVRPAPRRRWCRSAAPCHTVGVPPLDETEPSQHSVGLHLPWTGVTEIW